MTVVLCICTHDPRPGLLADVLRAVAAQEVTPGSFAVLLVDNASNPAIADEVLAPVRAAGIAARLLREPSPGLQRARLRAIDASDAEWILWVDDDNELAPDFVRRGLEFIAERPTVGCFGGRLLLPESLRPNRWVRPFLPYLGIRDLGDQPIVERLQAWSPAEPPGAGAWVRRSVCEEYRLLAAEGEFFRLGRTGSSNLASCDDSVMMRCAGRVGLACAYVPTLKLRHHLGPHRLRFGYLMKLMRAYGRSNVILERLLEQTPPKPGRVALKGPLNALLRVPKLAVRHGLPYALARVCYEYGVYEEGRAGPQA